MNSAEEKVPDDESVQQQEAAAAEEKPARNWFLPREGFVITPILIGINVMLFMLMVMSGANVFSPDMQSLVAWGGNTRALTIGEGEWWRIFTCMFEHIGIMHLLVNMISLYIVGMQLEPMIGKTRFLVAYIASGLAGSIASLLWNENVLSAGASGAIFGMFGVFLALLTTPLIERSLRKALMPNIVSFIVINLVMGFKPGVDFSAHIGGLLCGGIIGYLYFLVIQFIRNSRTLISVCSVLVLTIIVVLAGFNTLKNGDAAFNAILGNAARYEEAGIRAHNLGNTSSSSEERIKLLKDSTLPAFRKFKEEVAKLDALKLSEGYAEKRKAVKEYADLRLKFEELQLKSLEENTDKYGEEQSRIDSRVDVILEYFKKGGKLPDAVNSK